MHYCILCLPAICNNASLTPNSCAAEILAQVNESRRPVYVTQNGEAKAVLLDTESYEKMKKALGLLKLLAQGERDIVDGKVLSQEDFFSVMDRDFDNIRP